MIQAVKRRARALLMKCRRSFGSDYWRDRVRQYGKRSVLNLAHTEAEYEAVTEAQKQEIFPLLARCLKGDEKTLLDLGCGPGRFTPGLADLIKGKATGLDISTELLRLAPSHPYVTYGVMKEGAIPLADESMDVVWVCLVLGGIMNRTLARIYAEINRVLKKGGLLFLVENTSQKPSPEHWAFRSVGEYMAMFPGITLNHLHDYTDVGERISVMAGRKNG